MRKRGGRDNDERYTWYDLVVCFGIFSGCRVWDVSPTLDHEQAGEIGRYEGTIDGHKRSIAGGLSPRASASHMPEPEYKAFRVVGYEDANIPAPSEQLYNELALRGWNDYRRQMAVHVGHELPTWDDLPDHLKMVWLGVAHGQHGVMAWRGGGKIEMIKDDAE